MRRVLPTCALLTLLGAVLSIQPAGGGAAASAQAAPPPLSLFDDACLADNPYVATARFARGRSLDEPAVVAFHDTDNQGDQPVLATVRQIGAVYGLAYRSQERALYAAAYHKRGTMPGPLGSGGIYRIDLNSGEVQPWLTVAGTGTNMHDPDDNYFPDTRARDVVGVTGLADIDLDASGEVLYVMHLVERKIHRYQVADKKLLGKVDIGPLALKLPWATDARPFGLMVQGQTLYHGVIATAFKSQDGKDLKAHVFASALDGTGMREVLSLPLAYDRGFAVGGFGGRGGGGGTPARWQPWKSGYNTVGSGFAPVGIYPQPMLSDMEMTARGDMVLGFRDRNGDMTFFFPGGRNPPGEGTSIPAGDILLARRQGEGWAANPVPEFYDEDAGPGLRARTGAHEETSFGGLAQIMKVDRVIMSGMTPLQISSGGGFWFDNVRGDNTAREEVYDFDSAVNFGKANGLGDVEILCSEFVPSPTPSATATRERTATPTRTATATETVVPTVTDTLTPSATPTPYRIYLPFTEKTKPCDPDAYRTSVVLVLDRSTSMLRPVESGGIPKNEAAIEAAKRFLAFLQLEDDGRGRRDQVAVVGFNDSAWIEQPLTSDRAAALDALDRIRGKTQEGTRLDLAFQWGQKPLDGPERIPSNRPVIILLTDGLPNRVPFGEGSPYPGSRRQEDSVLQMAASVKAAGSRVYTVALGTPRDILPWLMIEGASERWMYHYAPRPEDLAGIYAQIAATFNECKPKPTPRPCSPEELHADIVLVLDMSTSMFRPSRGGQSKMAVAIAAAHGFAALLDLERDGWGRQDQLGIVGFNGRAWTAVGLSDDRAAIAAAIDGLPAQAAEGTRLDLAIRQGQAVLAAGPRLQPNQPVLVLMTDGLPNQVPFGAGSADPDCPTQECVVLRAAAVAKAAGTRLLTIGLGEGEDVLRGLLEQVATSPADYFFAPDAEDLAAIYRLVAGRIQVCP